MSDLYYLYPSHPFFGDILGTEFKMPDGWRIMVNDAGEYKVQQKTQICVGNRWFGEPCMVDRWQDFKFYKNLEYISPYPVYITIFATKEKACERLREYLEALEKEAARKRWREAGPCCGNKDSIGIKYD